YDQSPAATREMLAIRDQGAGVPGTTTLPRMFSFDMSGRSVKLVPLGLTTQPQVAQVRVFDQLLVPASSARPPMPSLEPGSPTWEGDTLVFIFNAAQKGNGLSATIADNVWGATLEDANTKIVKVAVPHDKIAAIQDKTLLVKIQRETPDMAVLF